jgi:hypothetical protein
MRAYATTYAYCLDIHSLTALGQNRTQVPTRKDGIFPAFACL